MRRYLRDPTFSRFDTIPECDGHTHSQTHDIGSFHHLRGSFRSIRVMPTAELMTMESSARNDDATVGHRITTKATVNLTRSINIKKKL